MKCSESARIVGRLFHGFRDATKDLRALESRGKVSSLLRYDGSTFIQEPKPDLYPIGALTSGKMTSHTLKSHEEARAARVVPPLERRPDFNCHLAPLFRLRRANFLIPHNWISSQWMSLSWRGMFLVRRNLMDNKTLTAVSTSLALMQIQVENSRDGDDAEH